MWRGNGGAVRLRDSAPSWVNTELHASCFSRLYKLSSVNIDLRAPTRRTLGKRFSLSETSQSDVFTVDVPSSCGVRLWNGRIRTVRARSETVCGFWSFSVNSFSFQWSVNTKVSFSVFCNKKSSKKVQWWAGEKSTSKVLVQSTFSPSLVLIWS